MPIFKTTEDIQRSLGSAGLSAFATEIIDTALPCLVFTRQLAKDGLKTMMESRMGGLPAVPDGFEWPSQPAFRKAKKRAKEIDEGLVEASQPLENPFNDEFYEELTSHMSADEIAKFKVEMEDMFVALDPPTEDDIAQMRVVAEAEKAALFKPFPMAFVGQINLGKLSGTDGFDEALPRDGLLSIFKDTRSWDGVVKTVHIPDSDVPITHMPVPSELVEYFDTLRNPGETAWDKRDSCEVLAAQRAISVPYHWGMPRYGDDLYEWLQEAECQLDPSHRNAQRETYFGDQLGGYPEVVQDLPEFDLMPKLKRSKVIPGKLPWRMVFSYGNEHFGETRQMASSGDGQSYLMMHMDGLARHAFEKVREVYQQT